MLEDFRVNVLKQVSFSENACLYCLGVHIKGGET